MYSSIICLQNFGDYYLFDFSNYCFFISLCFLVIIAFCLQKCFYLLFVYLSRINDHDHHHVVLPARISLTLSRNSSLSFIVSGIHIELPYVGSSWSSCFLFGHMRRSIGVHPLWARLCFFSSVLHVCVVYFDSFRDGGWWLYSWCFVGCCLEDLFKFARSILV